MNKEATLNRLAMVPEGVSDTPMELLETDAGPMWFPLLDEVMRCYIRNAGYWEAEVGNVLASFMPAKGGVFLDIGANVGYFSRLIAKQFPTSRIYAFEPHPLTYRILQLNAWPVHGGIHISPCALSDFRGTVVLDTKEHNLGDTRATSGKQGQLASTVVPASDLDSLCPDLIADVVKLDVQGTELAVLRGMAAVIRRSPAIKIVMEFWPAALEAAHLEPRAVFNSLRQLGLAIRLLHGGGPMAVSDDEIFNFAATAGPNGQANLLLLKE